jgi:hypothetical protein
MENKELMNTAIQGLIDRLGKVEKFTLDNLPQIAKEMVIEVTTEAKRDFVANLLTAVISLLGMAGMSLAFLTNRSPEPTPVSEGPLIITILLFLTFLVSTSYAYNNYEKLMFVKNCPNLFLLREFKELLVK